MASTLPSLTPGCCVPDCDDAAQVAVPGPEGQQGDPGASGNMGENAFTTLTAQFVMPAELGSAVATVAYSGWASVNQTVFMAKTDGSVIGYFLVTAIGGISSITLKNLEDTASGMYAANSAPGSIFPVGSKLCPAGIQGPNGSASGQAAGGDLKGTYLNPKIGIGNTKGSILAGNGTDTVAVPAGTNGHMLAYDSTDPEGLKAFKALPLLADTGSADNRIARLDRPLGTEVPVPMQPSLMGLTDQGALQISYGNAKGTDAIDLQSSHSAVTQVASGTASTISGGTLNTSAGPQSTVSGGDSNSAGGIASTVSGGAINNASFQHATIGGGSSNTASAIRATVGGGLSNTASAQGATVAGGEGSTASAIDATVGGGVNNFSTFTQATVAGGSTNVAAAIGGSIGGGTLNAVTGSYGHIAGGNGAVADHYGQSAWASGNFAAAGDAQASECVMRNNTTNATPTELFLDGAGVRLTIPVGKSIMFELSVVGRTSAGLDAFYTSIGIIRNNAGTTTVSGVTTTEVFDGTAGVSIAVTADNANDSLAVTVTGLGATLIRWVCRAKLTEVSYP